MAQLGQDIEVVEQSNPVIFLQMLDFRNDTLISNNGSSNANNIIDITGYFIELVIQREPVDFRAEDGYPQTFDPDDAASKYVATIVDASLGTFKFALGLSSTCCYGDYPAEIRWWSPLDNPLGLPSDRVPFRFIVNQAISTTYP